MSRPNGRPPVPTELRVLRGHPSHSSPKTRGAKGDLPPAVPPFPPSLREAGQKEWTRYWQHGRAWLAYTDISILTQLCEAQDEAFDLRQRIIEEGLLQVSEKTGRSFTHHLYNDLRGLRKEIREMWSLCYMTPTDRGRANAKPTEADPLADWQAQ
jgi:P27 family predicted phage terminase small subunit